MKHTADMPAYIYALRDPRGSIGKIKIYIGKAIKPIVRLNGHLLGARKTKTPTLKERWILGLLEEGVRPTIDILETCTIGTYSAREIHWLKRYDEMEAYEVLNSTKGGDGAMYLKEGVMERRLIINRENWIGEKGGRAKQKLSGSITRLWQDPGYRRGMVEAHKGQIQSPKSKAAILSCFKGRPWSENKRAAITQAVSEKDLRVFNVTTGTIFSSPRDAAKSVGLRHTTKVREAARTGKPFLGHIWEWADKTLL